MLVAAIVVLGLICISLGYLLWFVWEARGKWKARAAQLIDDVCTIRTAKSRVEFMVIYRDEAGEYFQGEPYRHESPCRPLKVEEVRALAETAKLKTAEAEKLQAELSALKVTKLRRSK